MGNGDFIEILWIQGWNSSLTVFSSPPTTLFVFLKIWWNLILPGVLTNAHPLTAFDQALEFHKNRTVPSNWKTELKEDSSSSEAEEEEEDEKEKEDNSSEEEASEVRK